MRRVLPRRLLAVGAVAAVVATALPAPAHAAVTIGTAPSVIINEVATTNLSTAKDEDGKFGDWIELYNPTSGAIDLAGWGLSNATKNPFRWVFPAGTSISAGSYLRVWADKADRRSSSSDLHTNFNIDNGVDAAVLSAPNGTAAGQLVDAVTPPRLTPDVSTCRMPSGNASSSFTTCLTPTPGKVNAGATAGALLATPTLSVASGVFGAAQTVTVSGPAGAQLRYTTDGSAPLATSALVTGPVSITSSATLRVKSFATGALPSFAATATYVIDSSRRFDGQRKIFVSMEPASKKSYVGGSSAPDQGWSSAVELIAPDGEHAFAGPAATEDSGQLGSRHGQETLPMDITFTDALGLKDVSYPIFSAKPTQTKFKKLRLRNAGDDYQEAHVRDQFWQSVGTEANLAPSASEPVQVFLNGSYYGMMDLREKEDETLLESSYGVDKDTTEYISDGRVVSGDNASSDWSAARKIITGNDLSVSANYARATAQLDVTNFSQDFAIHMFAADWDWAWRNMHYFRMPSYDNRWRYRIHDVDISADGTNAWGFNTKTDRNMNSRIGHESGDILKALLKNPTYKALYANVIADQLNSVLTPAELNARLDTFVGPMAGYIPNQVAQNGNPSSVAKWNSEVARLRAFFTNRRAYYEEDTRDYLDLSARQSLSVQTSDPSMGTVVVNTLDLTTRMTAADTSWTGSYWSNVPVTLTAKPKPGYVFLGWQNASSASTPAISVSTATAGRTYRAVFAAAAGNVPAPQVTGVADQTVVTGAAVSLLITATDPTGYRLSFKDKDLPSGLSVHPVTGMIYGKPTKAGVFSSTITATNGLTSTKITIKWTVSNALDRVVTLPQSITGDGPGLTGAYYASTAMTGTPLVSRVENPALEVGGGGGPVAGTGSSDWAVRWTGYVTVPVAGTYTLRPSARSDDGVRVTVGGTSVVDAWTSGAATASGPVTLAANTPTPIVIEFQDKSGAASLAMNWTLPGQTAVVPMDKGVFTPQT